MLVEKVVAIAIFGALIYENILRASITNVLWFEAKICII